MKIEKNEMLNKNILKSKRLTKKMCKKSSWDWTKRFPQSIRERASAYRNKLKQNFPRFTPWSTTRSTPCSASEEHLWDECSVYNLFRRLGADAVLVLVGDADAVLVLVGEAEAASAPEWELTPRGRSFVTLRRATIWTARQQSPLKRD